MGVGRCGVRRSREISQEAAAEMQENKKTAPCTGFVVTEERDTGEPGDLFGDALILLTGEHPGDQTLQTRTTRPPCLGKFQNPMPTG